MNDLDLDILQAWLAAGPKRAWEIASGYGIAEGPVLTLWDDARTAAVPLGGNAGVTAAALDFLATFTPGWSAEMDSGLPTLASLKGMLRHPGNVL